MAIESKIYRIEKFRGEDEIRSDSWIYAASLPSKNPRDNFSTDGYRNLHSLAEKLAAIPGILQYSELVSYYKKNQTRMVMGAISQTAIVEADELGYLTLKIKEYATSRR